MHWGHARTCDLIHWEHLPIALYPQHAAEEKHCCSGCLAFAADGRPYILYTSSKTVPAVGERENSGLRAARERSCLDVARRARHVGVSHA